MKRALIIVALALAAASCAPPQPDIALIRKAVEDFNARSAKDMVAGTWDSTMANYTDDAYSMPNFMPMSKGKQAIKEMYGKMMGMGMKITKAEFKTLDVLVAGDQVVEVGSYSMSMTGPQAGDMNEAGKYVTVFQRSNDGTLKVRVETWNSDTPPASHTPAN